MRNTLLALCLFVVSFIILILITVLNIGSNMNSVFPDNTDRHNETSIISDNVKTFTNAFLRFDYPAVVQVESDAEPCAKNDQTDYRFNYENNFLFRMSVYTKVNVREKLDPELNYSLSDINILFTVQQAGKPGVPEVISLGAHSFVKQLIEIRTLPEQGGFVDLDYSYAFELPDHYVFFYNDSWKTEQFEQMLSTLHHSQLACAYYPFINNKSNITEGARSALSKIESEYPDFKDYTDKESFAGRGFEYRVLDGEYFFAFLEYGSGIPIRSGICFKVDRSGEVRKISDHIITNADGSFISGVNPVTCAEK